MSETLQRCLVSPVQLGTQWRDGWGFITCSDSVAELKMAKVQHYQLTADDFGLEHYQSITWLRRPAEHQMKTAWHCQIVTCFKASWASYHEAALWLPLAANVAMLMRINGHEDLKQNGEHALAIIREAMQTLTASQHSRQEPIKWKRQSLQKLLMIKLII